MVQEPVAGCLKTHIPQDEVGKSNRESSHLPGSQLPDTGLPMSPRNQPSALQGPSTPTLFPTIACTSDIRRPGPLDVTSAIRSASSVVASLAAARFIADITTLSYPEGYQGPHPDLNQNVKNGKFRYYFLSSSKYSTIKSFIYKDMIVNFYYNLCRFARKGRQHFLLWMQLVSSPWITLSRCVEAGQPSALRVPPISSAWAILLRCVLAAD